MKKYLGCLVLSMTLFLGVQPVFAQANLEYQILTKEIQSLKQDIQELKKLVQGIKQAPAGGGGGGEFKEAMINIKGAPMRGDKNAKLALLEYTDYQ
ncbi:MAG: hypothetical protein M0R70_04785 [Nitrospirae bacterium]|nr:hypothetical protein [Nitrospirota bacterium]